MNTRERFLALMNFEPVDRTLKWELGYWAGTVRRWYGEGLPCRKGVPSWLKDGRSVIGEGAPLDPESFDPLDADRRDTDIHDYFGMDEPIWKLPLNTYFCPLYEEETIEDHADWILHRNEYGVILKDLKDFSSLPSWVMTPVNSRDDWEQIKAERLQPNLEARLPHNWAHWKEVFKNRSFPLLLSGYPCGFYGTARFLLGEEKVLYTFYDDPDLMHDIMNYMADLWVNLYDQVLAEVEVDGCLVWEDMCYKDGPLISPAMFREFMLPGYKRVSECLKAHGAKVILVDTDGNYWKLLPHFIEGGVTAFHPNEVNAGMDVVQLRKAYPKIAILGGLDKMAIAKGADAIDAELAAKVPFMVENGGYIPHVDHMVPPDISWENFKYYRQRLNQMIETN
jgi:uroporphyrinogen decarboxylase